MPPALMLTRPPAKEKIAVTTYRAKLNQQKAVIVCDIWHLALVLPVPFVIWFERV